MDMQFNKIMRRKSIVAYVFLTICVLYTAAFISVINVNAKLNGNTKITKKNDDFTVTAQYGLDGMVYYDSTMQVLVTLESKKNFNGELRIIPVSGYGQDRAAYGKKISLSAGESKTFKMSANTPNGDGVVYLSILDDNERKIYEEKTTLSLSSSGNTVVGVLSDDYSGVGYFNGVSVTYDNYSGTAGTVEFTADNFPEDSQVLDVVGYMIIDNFDTSTLSDKQYAALKKWVRMGGVLFVSLGSHYQSVLSGFKDDFLTGTLGDISKKTLTFDTTAEKLSLDDVECMTFTLDGGDRFLEYASDGTAYQKVEGLGRIVVLSYSLSMEPLGSYVRKADVASMLLSKSVSDGLSVQMSGFSNNQNSLGMQLSNVAENAKGPSVSLYGLLLTVYVVFVGPILYIILKKKNKREKLWVAIPIVALVFTAIIYCTSFIYRIRKPLFNSFTIIREYDDSAYEKVYSQVVCPRAKKYSLDISEDYGEFTYNINQYDNSLFSNSSSSDNGKYDYLFMDNGSNSKVILNSGSAFDKFDFAMGKPLDDIGHFTLNLDFKTTGFSGTVTNDTAYDLSDVIVVFENKICIVGDLKKGATATINENDISITSGYGTFDYSATGKAAAMSEKAKNINSNMESYMINVSEYRRGHVWGTINSYKPGLVNDWQVKSSGTAVILKDFTADYSDVSGIYYPDISAFKVNSDGGWVDDNGYMSERSDATITYSFGENDNIDTLCFMENDLDNGCKYADVYALNVDTGEFERVFEDSGVLENPKLSKYLSHNIIQLKFECGPDYSDYYVPVISASGK